MACSVAEMDAEQLSSGLHNIAIEDQGKTQSAREGREMGCEDHGGVCAICLEKIVLQETALVKGCEHAYCVTCILRWAAYNKKPTCPQCKHPFEFLNIHRTLDGRSVFSSTGFMITCLRKVCAYFSEPHGSSLWLWKKRCMMNRKIFIYTRMMLMIWMKLIITFHQVFVLVIGDGVIMGMLGQVAKRQGQSIDQISQMQVLVLHVNLRKRPLQKIQQDDVQRGH
ncbi:uncharacterized protein LOC131147996 isoform X2 [Malania oleifera]|uniref:uncharacterized protein LOC131147996 isoform X2 n=1 Tax=Malania oleifera TaxID=397392 RepID=UPI0025AE7E25|nr:uncharacterized protein LOC131147996 isoform X2 [Malania oleifera]